MSDNGSVDVTRREHEDIAQQTRENGKQLAAMAEWRVHRDKDLDGLYSLVREIKDEIRLTVAPIAEMVKTHAGTLLDFNNRLTIQGGEIATIKAENIALKAEVKTNTEARQELQTQLKTLGGLVRWLILVIAAAVGLLTFLGYSHRL